MTDNASDDASTPPDGQDVDRLLANLHALASGTPPSMPPAAPDPESPEAILGRLADLVGESKNAGGSAASALSGGGAGGESRPGRSAIVDFGVDLTARARDGAPVFFGRADEIETVLEAITKAGFTAGKDLYIAMDAAMTELYDEKTGLYTFKKSGGATMTTDEVVSYWTNWVNQYPILSIEDGLAEDDWNGWSKLNSAIGNRVQIVGDDLFVTNVDRVTKGIELNAANSVLVKVNQIGTLTETIATVQKAQRNGMTCIMSHRSGETEDSTIADLAVALNTGQIKTGSASRSDRMAKYNQLIRIEEMLGSTAIYPGSNFK
ncbi:MAG: hypothetical protein RL753_730 [Bacteroidota bacterium]